MIRLFDIEEGVAKPTVHCKMISWLNVIQEKFPDKALRIYGYLFYMTCPYEAENPYFNLSVDVKEDNIITDLKIDFSLDEDEITLAITKMTKLFETVTVRAYRGISTMIDNMTHYMETAKITAGRDGNISALTSLGAKYDDLRQSYKGVKKDLDEEQKAVARGKIDLAYDQM